MYVRREWQWGAMLRAKQCEVQPRCCDKRSSSWCVPSTCQPELQVVERSRQ